MHHVAGIGRPRLAAHDLKQIRIPVPPPEVQAALKDTFVKTQAMYDGLREQAGQLLKQADGLEAQAVENVAKNLCGV